MSESEQHVTPADEPGDTGQVATDQRENEPREAELESANAHAGAANGGETNAERSDPVEAGTSDVSDVGTGDTTGYTGTSSGETLGSSTPENGPQRDPSEWVTGDQPATAPQKSYLDTLAKQAGEELSADLTKAEASEHIERLQEKRDQNN